MISECVFKSCLLNSILSGLLVIPGVSTLPCLPLMLSLKTIILKYLLVCVFLISPCCVHRDRRPDQTVSVVPSPRFDLFVFSSVLFVPVFCPSRQASPLAASPHARGSREFYAAVRGSPIPRFAGLHARRSREFTPPSRLSHPLFAGVLAAVRGSAIPPFAGVDAAVRGSAIPPFAEFTPPFADHPALNSRGMTLHPRLTLARRPASDSMPAGLPLTQCPPACLWLNARRPASDSSSPGVPLTQARRIAADSSSPDCRWLKLAGLPLTHATGRRQGRPTHHCLFHAAVRGPPLFHVLLLRGESQPAVRGSLGPQPAEAPSSPPAPAVEWSSQPAAAVIVSQPIMVSPAGRCRIDKPAGRGRNWPVSDHGLFNCLCVFSPGGLLVPLSCPMVIFWGGTKVPAVVAGPRDEATAHHGPPALASWAPCSTLASVCLFHSGGPVLCMYPCLSWGVSRVPTPPPRWNCYGSGRAFREGGVMLEICHVHLVFPPPVSIYG